MTDFNLKRTWGPTPKYERVRSYKRKDDKFFVIAGPCSVESEEQIFEIAKIVRDNGGTHLRGGLYRAGTYPGDIFGLVDPSLLDAFKTAAEEFQLKTIIELLDVRQLELVYDYADCFQVGCRQMQHYGMLRTLGLTDKTIFLKRHPGSTMDEVLGAAEHLLVNGTCSPVIIERGSSTHMNHVRWDLSISMIPAIKHITELPVICDPSHGTGRRDLVAPMALAGVAAGADGVLIEVHTDPDNSLSDKEQAIAPDLFEKIMTKIQQIRGIVNG